VAFHREINNLIWQTEILAHIETKGLFRALANHRAAVAAGRSGPGEARPELAQATPAKFRQGQTHAVMQLS